jgi:hypothetical protein
VTSASSGFGPADVNAALPAPELHPAAIIITPISHHAKKPRVRIASPSR